MCKSNGSFHSLFCNMILENPTVPETILAFSNLIVIKLKKKINVIAFILLHKITFPIGNKIFLSKQNRILSTKIVSMKMDARKHSSKTKKRNVSLDYLFWLNISKTFFVKKFVVVGDVLFV